MSNAGIFATSNVAGADFNAKGSTALFKLLTPEYGSNGNKYVYAIAGAALGSTTTAAIGTGGTATALTVGTFTIGVAGGVATGQYFWARKTLV